MPDCEAGGCNFKKNLHGSKKNRVSFVFSDGAMGRRTYLGCIVYGQLGVKRDDWTIDDIYFLRGGIIIRFFEIAW